MSIVSKEEFLSEALIMIGLEGHNNVLTLLAIVIQYEVPYVVLPFMDNGDLKSYVSNRNNVSIIESKKHIQWYESPTIIMNIAVSIAC